MRDAVFEQTVMTEFGINLIWFRVDVANAAQVARRGFPAHPLVILCRPRHHRADGCGMPKPGSIHVSRRARAILVAQERGSSWYFVTVFGLE